MNRIVKINTCNDCPHFDNEYYDYEETCVLLNRRIPYGDNVERVIPEDCPLPKEEEKE